MSKVFINDENVVELVFEENPSAINITSIFWEVDKHLERLLGEGKKLRIVVDDTRVTAVDLKAKDAIINWMNNLPEGSRIAVYGLKPQLLFIGNIMIDLAGKKETVKLTKTREEALSWLK